MIYVHKDGPLKKLRYYNEKMPTTESQQLNLSW